MTHPCSELSEAADPHGSNLAADPVPDLSNQPLKEGECRRVCFMLNLGGGSRYGHSLYEVKTKGGKILGKGGEFLEPVSKLFDTSNPHVRQDHILAATRFNSRTKLYMLQYEGYSNCSTRKNYSYQAHTFDIMTRELKPFKPPEQHKTAALLISAYGKLYHLAQPSAFEYGMPDPAFEVYDPHAGSWKRCSPFPRYGNKDWSSSNIRGHAICYGCILVSVDEPPESPLWVYHVTLDKWSEVKIPIKEDSDYIYYTFAGKAVVIDDTIYAISGIEEVITFSLMMKQMADGSIEYSVNKPRQLHGLRTCFFMDSDCYKRSECLVHLGGLNFCLLQSIMKYYNRQRVWITTFDIIYKEGKRRIRTLDTTMREIDINCLGRFRIESGFTLECEEEREIVSTSSMMQPTDDPRLCKLQQAVNDKIRKQIRRRRQKTSKPRSRKLALLGNLFRPCREPKFGVY
ncbi:uncharacterized protein LOC126795001 [Argentina anserina]|uniref:uncharacterized protein LOC126795001 n=1 Tax=Argentina anserina TaxID=57926 RepID=UPI00217660CC|nr:uncharacterized protein LOC126795001 [Potentilla anserina]